MQGAEQCIYTGVVCEDGAFLSPSCVFTNVINLQAFIEWKREHRNIVLKIGASVGTGAAAAGNKSDFPAAGPSVLSAGSTTK